MYVLFVSLCRFLGKSALQFLPIVSTPALCDVDRPLYWSSSSTFANVVLHDIDLNYVIQNLNTNISKTVRVSTRMPADDIYRCCFGLSVR